MGLNNKKLILVLLLQTGPPASVLTSAQELRGAQKDNHRWGRQPSSRHSTFLEVVAHCSCSGCLRWPDAMTTDSVYGHFSRWATFGCSSYWAWKYQLGPHCGPWRRTSRFKRWLVFICRNQVFKMKTRENRATLSTVGAPAGGVVGHLPTMVGLQGHYPSIKSTSIEKRQLNRTNVDTTGD